MLVYFRDRANRGNIGVIDANYDDHQEAILEVQEMLVADGVGWDRPVLALVQGGKID